MAARIGGLDPIIGPIGTAAVAPACCRALLSLEADRRHRSGSRSGGLRLRATEETVTRPITRPIAKPIPSDATTPRRRGIEDAWPQIAERLSTPPLTVSLGKHEARSIAHSRVFVDTDGRGQRRTLLNYVTGARRFRRLS